MIPYTHPPLNPGGWPACPMCLSVSLYYSPKACALVCAGCTYAASDLRMKTGLERIWWERAAVLAWNGLPLSGRGRPVCGDCASQRLVREATNGQLSAFLRCLDCRATRSITGTPLMDDALLAADSMRVGNQAQEPKYPQVMALPTESMDAPTLEDDRPRRRLKL